MVEPFRALFLLGVAATWLGVGHWLAYGIGLTSTYSCAVHGTIQMQGFVGAFALGFLMTALPRRTGTTAASRALVAAVSGGIVVMAIGAAAERWLVAETAAIGVYGALLCFAVPRLMGGPRRAPAAFVLLPCAAMLGIAGAGAISAWALGADPAWFMRGRLAVEQGVPLLLVLGAGQLILPLALGFPPPPDSSGIRDMAPWLAAVAVLVGSLAVEAGGGERWGELLRAAVVAAGTRHAWKRPARPGAHRCLIHTAIILLPCGLVLAALLPDYRVPALHVTFMGGIGLLVMAIATHVSLGHLGMGAAASGRPRFVVVVGASILLALLARLAADFSHTYFDHLAWAAGIWLVGGAVWLRALAPSLVGWRTQPASDP